MMQKQIQIALLVAFKELKDFFRDPRSIILTLVLPVLLFPLLFWVLAERTPESGKGDRLFIIALAGKDPEFLSRTDPGYYIVELTDTSAAYSDSERRRLLFSKYDAVVVGDTGILYYNNADPGSLAAADYVLQKSEITEKPGDQQKPDTTLQTAPLYEPAEAGGKLFLALILPFMVFIFASTCPLPVAADMSAGEKERGSLEALLSTAAPRSGIITGKLLSAALAGNISLGAYFLGVCISALISPEILGSEAMTFNLNPGQYLVIGSLILLVTALFAALELTAGFMARSVREAQLLGMPMLFISMGAVYIAQSIDLQQVPRLIPHIPLVNLALVIREAALDRIDPYHAAFTFAWALLYLMCASWASVHRFKHESLIGGR